MFKSIGVILLVVAALGYFFNGEIWKFGLTLGLALLAIGVVVNQRVK